MIQLARKFIYILAWYIFLRRRITYKIQNVRRIQQNLWLSKLREIEKEKYIIHLWNLFFLATKKEERGIWKKGWAGKKEREQFLLLTHSPLTAFWSGMRTNRRFSPFATIVEDFRAPAFDPRPKYFFLLISVAWILGYFWEGGSSEMSSFLSVHIHKSKLVSALPWSSVFFHRGNKNQCQWNIFPFFVFFISGT